MTLYEHTLPIGFIVFAIVVALCLGVFSFWRFLPRNRYNALLGLLYLAVVALFAWCVLLPGRKDAVTRLLKPRFIVVLDTSASMTLTPSEEVPSRWAMAQEVLKQPWATLVGSECEIDVLPIGTRLGDTLSVAETADVLPEATSSRLRDGLKQISDRYNGLNVAGALLLSDGRDTVEAFDDWTAEIASVPLHTVRLQEDAVWEEDADLRIDDVHTPRRVSVDWSTEFKVLLSGRGTKGQSVTVQLFRNDLLVKEVPVQIPEEGGEREALFTLEHPEVGLFNYRVEVPALPGELNKEDNTYEVGIQVSDAKNRLLYVEGIPRWEYKFLKRTLLANKQVSPLIFYSGSDGKPVAGTPVGSVTAEMTEGQLALLKVVVLGNLEASVLTDVQTANLIRFVENGGSLVLLGGTKAWGEGGISSTELNKILPVTANSIQVLEGATPYAVSLTDTAQSHPAFAGDAELWATIPPVLSIFQGVEPHPAAQVLVQATTPQGMAPMVVSHRYGQGKVTAIFTDSLWKWQLSPEGAATKPYARFWGQLISWLLPKEEAMEQGRVDLAADRDRVFLGEVVELTARIGDSGNGVMRSLVTLPDGTEVPYGMNPSQTSTASGQEYTGYGLSFTAEIPGLHKVQAVWRSEGQVRESDPVSFYVKAFSPEMVPKPIHHQVLQDISRGSGGTFYENIEALDEALSSLDIRAFEEETAEYRTLWRTPWMIALMMLLLAGSWTTRKLRNMP